MAHALPLPRILRPQPIEKRFWQGGIALALFVLTLLIGNFVISDPGKTVGRAMLGMDFTAFYTAGSLIRDGRLDELYRLDSVRAFQHDLAARHGLELGDSFGPFWNPPHFALLFVPLAAWPYPTALMLWTAINLAALIGALLLLMRMLPPGTPWPTRLLVPLLVGVSMPLIQALSHGQNTCLSLLLVASIVTLWRARQALAVGVVCGLLFYKPQLAVVLTLVAALNLGPRVLGGLAITGSMTLLITGLLLPGALSDWRHYLPINLHFMQIEQPYLWHRHVTSLALWRLLLQGQEIGASARTVEILTLLTMLLVGTGLLLAILRGWRRQVDDVFTAQTSCTTRDRLIAATIVTTPLLMPFYFDYDLLLLAVPATLLAGERLSRPVGAGSDAIDRWLLRGWVGLYLWLLINPGMTELMHVNLAVVLLLGITGLVLIRAAQGPIISDRWMPQHLPLRVAVRRAA